MMYIRPNKTWLLALGLLLVAPQVMAAGLMRPLEAARPVPDFQLPGIDGRQHRLDDYRGRYLLVNFWAVWCTPCQREMPSMQRAYQRFKGERFDMLAVHVGPSLKQARTYAESRGLEFPILVDSEMDLSAWQVVGLPTSYLLDPQGRIVAEAVGERDWDSPGLLHQLEAYIHGK